ncbi:hypothetical protein [Acinetobacter haemolyticus]|uniref:Transposase n=1 Tax=Acinetobacter haemolyticus TaxID=29430 RepID=A0AAW4J197_ACIHA|nr:hypothetical protein [Acinetobacter haemolyticus]MBO3656691.1 hypothetical protein [Acinetobacter haemolyticus]
MHFEFKNHNREINKRRIGIKHIFGKLKKFMIFADSITALPIDYKKHMLYVISENGQIRSFPLRLTNLQMLLKKSTSATLTPSERMNFLNESEDTAYKKYSASEHEYGRIPLPANWYFNLPF